MEKVPESSGAAQAGSTVVVPMAVQALMISEDITQTSAQFAPLIEPDYATLLQTPGAGAPKHDLMDDIDISYWRTQTRSNPRFVNLGTGALKSNRTGIYLSWCLPKLYRAAITATGTARANTEEWNSRKLRAGFKLTTEDKASADEGQADSGKDEEIQFRSAPDRWVIVRKIRGKPQLRKEFIVESNRIRKIDDPELVGSLETQSCPAMDPNKPIGEQPMLRLGRSVPLAQDSSKLDAGSSSAIVYREPFNAFELGHEFFPDYAPSNMGVFSFFDDLKDFESDDKGTGYAVDYLVIGFHSKPLLYDPFAFADEDRVLPLDDQAEDGEAMSNEDLMKCFQLTASNTEPATTFNSALATKFGRTLTHGVIRSIRWNRRGTPREVRWPAATLQEKIHAEHPITIGTHILDALTTYLHISMDEISAKESQETLEQLLIRVSAQSNNVNQLARAAEDTGTHAFLSQSEGFVWKLPKNATEDSPKVFTTTVAADKEQRQPAGERRANAGEQLMQRELLATLNEGQMAFDACTREIQHLFHNLYGCWWNANSIKHLVPGNKRGNLMALNKTEAQKVEFRLKEIFLFKKETEKTIHGLKERIETSLGAGQFLEKTPASTFGKHQDPTVLLAGVSSGWPKDFGKETLSVRIANEILTNKNDNDTKTSLDKFLPEIAEPANHLLQEFDFPILGSTPNPYADLEDWKATQGWFPLFLEWKLEYYHVPFSKWELVPDLETGLWHYAIPTDTNPLSTDPGVGQDMCVIGGRIPFTPQPGASLRTRLEQLLTHITAGDEKQDDEEQKLRRKKLLERAEDLEYFSSSLVGLADHLLTRSRGHHPNPNPNDAELQDMLGISNDMMNLLAEDPSTRETAPYGLSTPLPPSYTASFNPFKPVTHGQARFVKFGIVDKFGQVVSGLSLNPNGDGALYPNVSPSLACGLLPSDKSKGQAEEEKYWPNTAVQAEDGHGLCQFFQISPRINQSAKLNASFLVPLSDQEVVSVKENKKTEIVRQMASEWDNPIWAWLLPNFQNHAIHVYLPDGEFRVEALLDMENKKVITSRGPTDKAGHIPVTPRRLAQLLEAINNYEFSENLFRMLAGASDSIGSSSADFDSSLPAALGKPFCIADIGVSIELSSPPLQNGSLQQAQPSEQNLLDYDFSVACGNPTAAFDGLIGTFTALGEIDQVSSAFDYDFDHVLGPDSPGVATIIKANRKEHPPLITGVRPYFIPGTSKEFGVEHRRRLSTVSMILDPKTPVRLYTGSLFPVAELSLPRWPIDAALRSMRAFFAVGPMLVPSRPVTGLYRPLVEDPDKQNPASAVQMPLGGGDGTGTWSWLQPWSNPDDDHQTAWERVVIRPLDTVLKVEDAAQSELVDGYVLVK